MTVGVLYCVLCFPAVPHNCYKNKVKKPPPMYLLFKPFTSKGHTKFGVFFCDIKQHDTSMYVFLLSLVFSGHICVCVSGNWSTLSRLICCWWIIPSCLYNNIPARAALIPGRVGVFPRLVVLGEFFDMASLIEWFMQTKSSWLPWILPTYWGDDMHKGWYVGVDMIWYEMRGIDSTPCHGHIILWLLWSFTVYPPHFPSCGET